MNLKNKMYIPQLSQQEKDSAGSSKESTVDSTNNNVYFTCGVTEESVSTLNKKLIEADMQCMALRSRFGIEDPEAIRIKLHISSYGGSVFAAWSAIDTILNSTTPVDTYVKGYAASAGTLMSVAGARRYITKNSYMLIHQLSSGHWGKYEELKDDMKNSETLMEHIKQHYMDRTSIPKTELKKILKHDLWWNAEKCVKYTLADRIV